MGARASIPLVVLPRDFVVIVTGGDTGIGYETAKFISMMGPTVIIACRSKEKAERAIEQMNEEFQEEKANLTQNIISDDRLSLEFGKLDLASLKSTMEFVENFKASGRKLHVLICNAGVMMSEEIVTDDNYELTYQVNYLSQFLIMAHFLPIMKKSGNDVRIVLVSSAAHKHCHYDANYAAGVRMAKHDPLQCYSNTKLYQIMQMYSIDRMLEKTHVELYSVHPGYVTKDLYRRNRHFGKKFNCFRCCLKCLCMIKTPRKGSATTIYAAVSPELKGLSRAYFTHSRDAAEFPSQTARDRELQDYLLQCTIDNLRDLLPEDFIQEALRTVKKTNTKSSSSHH
ncbi:dehydrogenase/reductase SDR family member on chromosome X-like [Ylistrum balloti]|uniref:dehydrogenase/reductase SDR family member on chromosome X-like n=1 Tax=Ylistrum balloti TaxID=509963 RepID=UPI002905D060|nr:dehydrogenase/reductase SDR family member on chromosome X-like [Ylistrum balloti]